jgi:hypothetical protein
MSNASVFNQFPEFSKLAYKDKHAYEAFIAQYPPISDIAFPTLMTWRNQLDSLSISILNDNLVISYWLPGDEKHSGLSLIGTNKVNESIATIFDHLRGQNQPVRLVHVPEFTMGYIEHPAMLTFTHEPEYDECILEVGRYYPLQRDVPHRQRKVKQFISEIGEKNIAVRCLDLVSRNNRELLLATTKKWLSQGVINKHVLMEMEAMKAALLHAEELGLEAMGIWIRDELAGFSIYQLPADRQYVILCHLKIDQSISRMFEFALYAHAKYFADKGITLVNIENDWALPHLKATRLILRPADFFRKYIVEPRRGI